MFFSYGGEYKKERAVFINVTGREKGLTGCIILPVSMGFRILEKTHTDRERDNLCESGTMLKF